MKLFLVLLSVLFVGLKLGEVGAVAAWSWWLVLMPLYIVPIIIIILALVVALLSDK